MPVRARSIEPELPSSPSATSAPNDKPGAAPLGAVTPPYIVLVGLDLSEPGGRAWRFAFDLAELRGEAEIHAVVTGDRHLAPTGSDAPTPYASAAHEAPSALRLPKLRVLEHRSAGGGPPRLMAMHFRVGRADRAIVGLAKEIGADLIVIAAQPTTRLQRLLGSSVTDRIARSAPCPVVVVRPKEETDERQAA
jgi:nucleotide-binding universal stress UspA family protein